MVDSGFMGCGPSLIGHLGTLLGSNRIAIGTHAFDE